MSGHRRTRVVVVCGSPGSPEREKMAWDVPCNKTLEHYLCHSTQQLHRARARWELVLAISGLGLAFPPDMGGDGSQTAAVVRDLQATTVTTVAAENAANPPEHREHCRLRRAWQTRREGGRIARYHAMTRD